MMTKDQAIIIARRTGAVLLPDNDRWTNRFQIKSETSSRLYTVAQNKANGRFGCSCMGWIRHKHCKHLAAMKPFLENVERLNQ
jgi:hypothetical protein